MEKLRKASMKLKISAARYSEASRHKRELPSLVRKWKKAM